MPDRKSALAKFVSAAAFDADPQHRAFAASGLYLPLSALVSCSNVRPDAHRGYRLAQPRHRRRAALSEVFRAFQTKRGTSRASLCIVAWRTANKSEENERMMTNH